MSRFVKISYMVCSAVLMILFLVMLITCRLDVSSRGDASGYAAITDFNVESVPDSTAEQGLLQRYTFTLDESDTVDRVLAFFTYHQYAEVKIGGETVYGMRTNDGNPFGRTPGCVWNHVAVRNEDLGKTAEVILEPVYKDAVKVVPDFLLGSKYDIYRDKIIRDLPSLVLGTIAVCLGLIYVIYIVYNRKNTEVDRSLLMLGLFSVQVGLWKITDADAIHILLPGSIVVSYVPYFTLMLIAIPFSLFIKSLHSASRTPAWYIPCLFSIGSAAIQLPLQLAGIADLREMLWLTHISLFVLCADDMFLIIKEIRTRGWSRRVKINVSCIVLCFAGLILDMCVYYVSMGKAQTALGLLGFTTYNVVLGLYTIREAKALMAIGMQAKKLENKAFHDQLTGLNNRTAFADLIHAEDFEPEKCVVVMFDLNNLKRCNDTYGHEIGDRYICQSARIISECFADLGPCYRMGGDEFCALVQGCSLGECKKRLERVEKLAAEYNKTHEDIHIGIACGYEVFDRRIDYDINDTLRRADKMMYEKKFSMKHQDCNAM